MNECWIFLPGGETRWAAAWRSAEPASVFMCISSLFKSRPTKFSKELFSEDNVLRRLCTLDGRCCFLALPCRLSCIAAVYAALHGVFREAVEFERGSCAISRLSDDLSSLAILADRSCPALAWARESWRLGQLLPHVESESLSESSHRFGYFSLIDCVFSFAWEGLSSITLVSVLAVPLASMVRTTDVRT